MRDCTFLKELSQLRVQRKRIFRGSLQVPDCFYHTHVQYLQLVSDLMVIKGLCCGREKPVCVSLSACGQVVLARTHSISHFRVNVWLIFYLKIMRIIKYFPEKQ